MNTPSPLPPPAASPVVLRRLAAVSDDDGTTVTAQVCVDPADRYLRGHFPGNPVYPGVFLLDLLERAVLTVLPENSRLLGVESARFTTPARDGDTVELSVRVPPGEPGRPRTVRAVFTGHGERFATVRAVFGHQEGS